MSLDVEIPDPPSLRGPQSRGTYEAIDLGDGQPADDHRREEIRTVLEDGAWADGFAEWAEHTNLSAEEFEAARDLGLIDEFDFYWDPGTDEVGYRPPAVPGNDPGGFDGPDAAAIEAELDGLGRVVSEVLENDYLLRDEEAFGFFADDYTGRLPSEEEE